MTAAPDPAPRRGRKPTRQAATVSQTILDEIARRGLSAHKVAVAAGLPPSVVSRFISGQRSVSAATIDALAGVLELTLRADGRRGLR